MRLMGVRFVLDTLDPGSAAVPERGHGRPTRGWWRRRSIWRQRSDRPSRRRDPTRAGENDFPHYDSQMDAHARGVAARPDAALGRHRVQRVALGARAHVDRRMGRLPRLHAHDRRGRPSRIRRASVPTPSSSTTPSSTRSSRWPRAATAARRSPRGTGSSPTPWRSSRLAAMAVVDARRSRGARPPDRGARTDLLTDLDELDVLLRPGRAG